ncbi:MAG TPA: ABC transporter substrate-binding protein, partial [Sulfitobacter sp.]|nr:ABC transporter substrate-binding protein [Sulfitobacter sp.]
ELLAEAGFADGIDLEVQVPNTTIPLQLMQVVQSMAAEAGINISITSKEFATLLADQSAGDYQASQIGWSGRVDPDGNIHQFMTSDGGINDSKFSNPEVDELLNKARKSNDQDVRRESYTAARAILNEELPIVYLYHQTWIWALDSGITGFTPYPDGMIRLAGMKKEEG